MADREAAIKNVEEALAKLAPCPFCGAQVRRYRSVDQHTPPIVCVECSYEIDITDERWNQRRQPAQPDSESADGAERDALRQMWEATDEPIHLWFGLSYASFFVMPRTVMQSMPADWQRRFIALIDESATTFPDWDARWNVTMRDERGRFVQDPLGDYERGRRRLTPGVPPRGEEA